MSSYTAHFHSRDRLLLPLGSDSGLQSILPYAPAPTKEEILQREFELLTQAAARADHKDAFSFIGM